MNWKLIEHGIVAIMLFVSFRCLFDWITYVVKTGARSAILGQRVWLIGWICTIGLIYYALNGFAFFNTP